VFTADNYREPDGAKYHTYPSLKSANDVAALWKGLVDGVLSTVATDEMCTTRDVKLRGKTIDDVTGGHAGVEVRMAVVYTEAVAKRQVSLQRFVELTSTNAAKILGLYPSKGVIAVGSDADLVLLDPTAAQTITASRLHETDYTPWEGYEVAAWPVTTILRGMILAEGGQLRAQPGVGQLVKRRISPEVAAGPRC
jgi:dihydropyrimidinase